jgi:ABC-type sugar transport system ATPase subunit
MTARLVLRELRKRFGESEVVRGLNLSLGVGEFLSLLGPSGCGKSTTLAMIAGFEQPTSGAVVVEGKDVTGISPAKRRIGLVFQDYAVFSRLTVRENLAFGLEVARVPWAERTRRIKAMAAKLQLQPVLERRGSSLNMSEMQRVAVARALITEPRLLLLDEPMSNLDASLRLSLRSELKLIQKELGQTVLYVTHDQTEAMAMSDRIAIMQSGEIEQLGTPEDVYSRPATRFVAEFIGDPPMNLIDCTVERSGARAAATTVLHGPLELGRIDVPEGSHILGIRPHDLQLSKNRLADGAETTVAFVENLGAEQIFHVR